MITLEIDNKTCQVPEGTTILQAARSLNIEIPTLCHLRDLTPDGSCRLCTVEIANGRKGGLLPSCSEPCVEGMVVKTQSKRVRESRRFILDLLLSNHVLQCFSCPSNGNCKLQDYSLEYGLERTSFTTGKRISEGQKDTSNPLFDYTPELCIMCRRCTRVCSELQGRDVISVSGRGFATKMTTANGLAWENSTCESCGNCVSVCPTGALSSKDSHAYRMWEVKKTKTTCPHCGTGCQMQLLVKNNRIVGVEPAEGPANSGLLCVKGKFGSYKFVHSPDRITTPYIRKEGKLLPASWDEAFDRITTRLLDTKANYGPDSIAGFSCARATNEDNYLFQKMMRAAVGTNNVDNCARVCHSSSVHGLSITLGSGAMTNPIKDITRDVDAILLVGSNPTDAHPVIGAQIRQAVLHGAKLIVVDPRRIDLVAQSELYLQIKPGTNVAFANGMMNVIISEGLADTEFIESRTEGYEELAALVADYTPEKVAAICHIDAEDLKKAAIMYAKADKAPLIYSLGVAEHSSGTEGVMSMSNLAMLVGKLGRSGCGINPLRGQNNVQGACDMGALPDNYPGYQKVFNQEVREKFEEAWGVALSPNVGLTSTQVMPAARAGEIKALFIFGEDPVQTDPDTKKVIESLNSLEFLVVQDLFMTPTAEMADVVLPGISYAEKEGTFTNTERRIQRVRKAVSLSDDMKTDSEIIIELMNRLGYPQPSLDPAGVMDEIASLTPSYRCISLALLDGGYSFQWPCPDIDHPGTDFLHKDRFTRGLGLFYPAAYKPSQELPDESYPLLLNTGRMLYHYNARSMTGRTEGINALSNESYIEINLTDAKGLGITDGDRVKVTSRRGEIETNARVGDIVDEGEVFMTFHFPDANVNHLTNDALDDISRIPEFKVAAVKIEKA